MGDINWKTGCWVTTIFLVQNQQVLLSWNLNLQTWIPVGGHIDPGEQPHDAIKREVAEETGLEFEFVPEHTMSDNVKNITPVYVRIDPVHHHKFHINLVYAGRVTGGSSGAQTDEGEKLRWFSREDLQKESMPESVKEAALHVLEKVSNR